MHNASATWLSYRWEQPAAAAAVRVHSTTDWWVLCSVPSTCAPSCPSVCCWSVITQHTREDLRQRLQLLRGNKQRRACVGCWIELIKFACIFPLSVARLPDAPSGRRCTPIRWTSPVKQAPPEEGRRNAHETKHQRAWRSVSNSGVSSRSILERNRNFEQINNPQIEQQKKRKIRSKRQSPCFCCVVRSVERNSIRTTWQR